MKRDTHRTTREAAGCFLGLVLGAIMCLGVMRIVVLAISQRQQVDQSEWWRSIVLWMLAPGAGLAVIAWLVYGFERPRNQNKRG
jgi:uncharacterized membrane protein required for colicin V production